MSSRGWCGALALALAAGCAPSLRGAGVVGPGAGGEPGSTAASGPAGAPTLPAEAAVPSLCSAGAAPCRAQLQALVAREPARADAWRELGWTDYLDGAREPARKALARARALAPADARVNLGLALLDDEEGDPAAALEGFLGLLERAEPGDPWAAAAAFEAASQARRLVFEVPGAAAHAARLDAIDPRRLGDDEVADLLLSARARLRRRLGDEGGGRRLDAERGCPARLATFGPYGHLPLLDLETSFAADAADPAAGGLEAPVRDCAVTVATPQGRRGVAYAVAWVSADRAVTARVWVANLFWHLVVDGQTVFRQTPVDRWPAAATTLEVALGPGLHRVALKIATSDGRTGASLRVLPAPGLTLLEARPAGEARVARGRVTARERPVPGLAPAVAAEEPRLAVWLAARRLLARGDQDAAEALSARLEREAPRFAPGQLLAAEVDNADPTRPRRVTRDRARRHYERVLALAPASITARYLLTDLDLDEEHPDRAQARLEAAPALGSWRLAWGRFRVLHARDWDVEAERSLAEARRLDPEACLPLQGEIQVALDHRDPRRAVAMARELTACDPDSEQLGDLLRGELGEPVAAAEEYRRVLALDPSRESALRGLGESLAQAGQHAAAATVWRKLIALQPRSATWRRHLADALFAGGDEAGARQAILDGLAQSPEAQELHRTLAALGVSGVMDPFRLDGPRVIADFERSGRAYPSPAVIVLDRTVTRVFPTGARLTITHNIMRVQTKDGIDKFGEVTVPEGADVLLLRAIKADGSTREAQEIGGKRSVSVPDLAPGDYVEFEYIEPSGSPLAFPGGFYGERFYFQSFDAPLDRTEFVLAAPVGMPLQIDARGEAPAVQVAQIDDPLGATAPGGAAARLEVRTWSDGKKAQLVAEPHQAPFSEYVPSVRVASGASFAGWRDFLVDNQYIARRANRELRELAARLGSPEAIDEWVRRHVKQGGSLDEPATSVLARGEGSRVVLERALLQAIGVRSTIWLARSLTDARLDGPLPDLEAYDEPLLSVEARAPAARGAAVAAAAGRPRPERDLGVVVDPRFRHAPLGFVAPLLRGARALSLAEPHAPEARFVTVPDDSGAGSAPARQVTLEATLGSDGGAEVSVREELTGWPALEWREGLERIDEGQVRAEFEQRTLGFYFPGASLTSLTFGPRDRDGAPFVVEYRLHAPRFARADGDRLVLGAPYAVTLARRYVGVAQRATPLQLQYASPTSLTATIHLPPGATASVPAARSLPDFGQFTQEVESKPGLLVLHQRFAMPPDRVAPARYPAFVRWAEDVDRAEARAAVIDLGAPAAARER